MTTSSQRLATVGGDLYIDSNELLTTFYLQGIDAVGTAGTGALSTTSPVGAMLRGRLLPQVQSEQPQAVATACEPWAMPCDPTNNDSAHLHRGQRDAGVKLKRWQASDGGAPRSARLGRRGPREVAPAQGSAR